MEVEDQGKLSAQGLQCQYVWAGLGGISPWPVDLDAGSSGRLAGLLRQQLVGRLAEQRHLVLDRLKLVVDHQGLAVDQILQVGVLACLKSSVGGLECAAVESGKGGQASQAEDGQRDDRDGQHGYQDSAADAEAVPALDPADQAPNPTPGGQARTGSLS